MRIVSNHFTALGISSGDWTNFGMDNVATIIPSGKAIKINESHADQISLFFF